jgi:capsular polysaccharide biosynthesis protein
MSIVSDIVQSMIAPVTGLISEAITDKDKAAEIAFKIATMAAEQAHAEVLAQIEVNKVEAASGSLFVSGWRPGMGWTCVAAYFLAYVGLPMLAFTTELFGKQITMPTIDFNALSPVLLGMLGLGVMRSFDKVKGTA